MVEDAVEAIGFGTFQLKLSILTGLSWVKTVNNNFTLRLILFCIQYSFITFSSPLYIFAIAILFSQVEKVILVYFGMAVFVSTMWCWLCADGRCHGDDDPQYTGPSAALWVGTTHLASGTANLGTSTFLNNDSNLLCLRKLGAVTVFLSFSVSFKNRQYLLEWWSALHYGETYLINMAEKQYD